MAKQLQNSSLGLHMALLLSAMLFMQYMAFSQKDTSIVRFTATFYTSVADTVHFICKLIVLLPKPVAVIFKKGSAKINRRDSILLATVILGKLKVCPACNIMVPASNLEGFHGECALDWRRTEALVLYFIRKGIAEKRIVLSSTELGYTNRNIFNIRLTYEKPPDSASPAPVAIFRR